MADMEPPSFSLGLDLDLHADTHLSTPLQQTSHNYPAPSKTTPIVSFDGDDDENFGRRVIDSNEEDFGLHVMDSDPEPGPDSPRVFKRLRRGPAADQSGLRKTEMERGFCDTGNDDIEEFSSQEDFIQDDKHLMTCNSICSSSKVPLCRGGLINPSSSQLKEKNTGRTSDVPYSSCLGTGQYGFIFPKLTISPLRRFQLVDSDIEELPTDKDVSRKIPESEASLKTQQPSTVQPNINLSAEKHQSEDLWKDFTPMKSFNISTPALDEVCEEYFQSLRDRNASVKLGSHLHKEATVGNEQDANASSRVKQGWNLADPVPPAHHYFFHDDPRIRKLVRCRLSHFFPLGISRSKENVQPSESVINYKTQFNGEASQRRTTQMQTNETGSTSGRGKSRKANAKEAQSSVGWVDPKISATVPKVAGKRRVQAIGQGGGRWYTSPEGKKVYVSKDGRELSGQMAYRHYKKDSGGFRKSRKKTNVKGKKG